MTISLGQILVILLIALLVFGNFPNIIRDLVKSFRTIVKPDDKRVEKQEKRDSNP
jgi:Sec-independent protein translocase protein TatA